MKHFAKRRCRRRRCQNERALGSPYCRTDKHRRNSRAAKQFEASIAKGIKLALGFRLIQDALGSPVFGKK